MISLVYKTKENREKAFSHEFIYLTLLGQNDLDARIMVKFTLPEKKRVISLENNPFMKLEGS
jgi:hypothetical protein